MKGGLAASVLVAAMAVSCAGEAPVRPQWTVTLRTDAPVPIVADRVLVEVLRDDGSLACDECRRLLDASRPELWPISFGIGAPAPQALRVRARLHRAQAVGLEGEPRPEAAVELVAALPRVPGPVALELRMRCFGLAATSLDSCDPTTGELAPVAAASSGAGDPRLVPGSWSESTSPPCASEAPPGMACVPGGLFFFTGFDGEDAARDQLVRLSSFFADRDEMTVGRARALLAAKKVQGSPARRRSDKSPGSVCAYLGESDASNDERALNCVARTVAEELCAAEGKRLLTEAELAYAAGNGARGTHFPWGEDDDICAHAIVARGAVFGEVDPPDFSIECRSQGPRTAPFGPVLGGSPADQTKDTGGLRNLGGNLAEWVAGTFAPLSAPCWTGRPLLVDALCTTGDRAVIRGGSWRDEAWTANARFRVASSDAGDPGVGFRCAKDAH
ncbi:MAG TPA: SUMF1/EgtB/PvdO family nonheme iron enzyme [Labilithrix sp.]|nr:SUMF1/EgtB/PvdO family nonheme iron enzyme [Labilithrix sp.]